MLRELWVDRVAIFVAGALAAVAVLAALGLGVGQLITAFPATVARPVTTPTT